LLITAPILNPTTFKPKKTPTLYTAKLITVPVCSCTNGFYNCISLQKKEFVLLYRHVVLDRIISYTTNVLNKKKQIQNYCSRRNGVSIFTKKPLVEMFCANGNEFQLYKVH